MKLVIDTSKKKAIIKLDSSKVIFSATDTNRKQQILKEIEKLLKSQNKKISDISEIEIVPGPGPFTSLRVGVSIANALASALNIPIVNARTKKIGTVAVAYDRPSNITRRKTS